jgi:hypothetical protein
MKKKQSSKSSEDLQNSAERAKYIEKYYSPSQSYDKSASDLRSDMEMDDYELAQATGRADILGDTFDPDNKVRSPYKQEGLSNEERLQYRKKALQNLIQRRTN